ncbi:MAG: glycosyltransferase [Ruminococcaceae bacterium]|nr:glycosyltransferase [Oscillospiraceae bacterium]
MGTEQKEAAQVENRETASPLVSIAVLAYNHLDYTRQCIESIYRYTSHIDFELITINNGSSDGTEEYFNSLPNQKKISFPENIGVCKAFNCGFKIAEGKYTMNVSNDVVVTAHWLDNLLNCFESDSKIGMVVPVCDASCNYQQINLPCQSMEEMQRIAERYNVSNPDLWEERLKMTVYAAIYRTEILKVLGGFDEDFNPGCYDDDAICFSIRRMGYKTILAKDTFVHHFGARTFNAEYEKDKNLAIRNKGLFFVKFGVDAYIAGLIDFNVLNVLDYDSKNEVSILGLGGSFGTTVLQLKNVCKSHGCKDVELYYLSERSNNMTELKTICRECVQGPAEDVQLYFGGRQYDYIVLESESAALHNREGLFTILYGLLKPGGQLVCTAAGPEVLYEMMGIFYRLGADFQKQINNYYYLSFARPEQPSGEGTLLQPADGLF